MDDPFKPEAIEAARLGKARDLDVLIARAGDNVLREQLCKARARAYRNASRALRSVRARALMIDLAAWIAIGDWRAAPETRARQPAPSDSPCVPRAVPPVPLLPGPSPQQGAASQAGGQPASLPASSSIARGEGSSRGGQRARLCAARTCRRRRQTSNG